MAPHFVLVTLIVAMAALLIAVTVLTLTGYGG
jgi:hypothetical protein